MCHNLTRQHSFATVESLRRSQQLPETMFVFMVLHRNDVEVMAETGRR